jgi:Protein of unknown function (DUF4435)
MHMELIAEMIDSQNAAVVGYSEFLQKYKAGEIKLHCFYEAQDDVIYYHTIVRRISGREDAMPHKCRNKDGVLKVYRLIKRRREYLLAKTCYFIDRDFDKLCNNPEIYETPFYSIENFYTHPTTFERILVEQFEMTFDHADFVTSTALFQAARSKFHQKVLPLNAYLSCCAHARMKNGNPRLNIDDKINVKNGVSIDLKDFNADRLPQDLIALEALFETPGLIRKEDFEKEVERLSKLDMGQVFRGKFELQFVESFLKRFKSAIERKKGHLLHERYTCSIQFSYDVLFTQLSSYAYVPDCLRTYILSVG